MGMRQASDHDDLDMVFPFIGGLIDLCCGLEDGAPIKKPFTLYVDLVDYMHRRRTLPVLDSAQLSKLREMITIFKSTMRNAFACYQPSKLGTSNCHSL